MTRTSLRKKARAARRAARLRQDARTGTPWLVAGAFVASAALGKTDLGAQVARPLPLDTSPASVTAGDQPSTRFDITAGPLADVIAHFEQTTRLRVRFTVDEMRLIDSPGASGVLTVDQALRQILAGTSIGFHFEAAATVVLEFRAASTSVDVTANAPHVSSPKFNAPLRDIPQTINVIPSRLFEEQGASTLRDALRNVTGITFQAGEGGTPAGDQMTIRGFSARTDMFIDGIRDTSGYSRDTYNLEQIEVAKGPSSAISGRGSTGGSINLVSKTPHVNAAYAATLEAGTADFERTTVDLNQPLSDGAAIRVNAMWTDGGVPRRDVVENQSWALAPSIAFGLKSSTRLNLAYQHLDQDNVPDYGLPWVPAANVPLAEYANNRPPVRSSNYYGLRARDFETIDQHVVTADLTHVVGAATIRNVARYGTTGRRSATTSPRFASNATTDIRRTDVKWRDQNDAIAANQTNLTGRFALAGLRHEAVAGVELARERSVNHAGAEFGPADPTSPTTDLYHPNPDDLYTGSMRRTGAHTDATADSAALYAFDTVKISEAWQFTAGLRWDRFDVEYDSVSAAGVLTPLSRTDRIASWRAGAVYKPASTGSVYLGFATSVNPSAEGLALTASTVNVEPEKTRTLEAGTKWDLSHERVSLSAAIFRTEKTNARTPGINPGDAPTVLEGRQIVSGLELGLSGRFSRRWTGIVNYSFMHSDIAASNVAAEVDQSLQFTPKSTFHFWSTLDLRRSLRIGGGVQYMDSVFRNAINTTSVPSYWLIGSLVSYEVNQHLSLRVNGNNLGNADYVDRTSGGHFIPGPGRSLLASASLKF